MAAAQIKIKITTNKSDISGCHYILVGLGLLLCSNLSHIKPN